MFIPLLFVLTVPHPTFNNNPQLDVVCTNTQPILSVGNPEGVEQYTITYELSRERSFQEVLLRYEGITQQNPHISEKQIEVEDALDDGTYYWRAKTVTEAGESDWNTTRFYVDVENSQTFSGYLRAEVLDITVSGGQDAKNIIDWNDQGQVTYWNSEPAGANHQSWVMFDMGKPTPVRRFWMLSTRNSTLGAGWLKDFVWQGSSDGVQWVDIQGTKVVGNDTYRNIIDFEPVHARYYRLSISTQNALQGQLNCIIPYVKGEPETPTVPEGDYVLIVGNQMNGFTYTQLAAFVEAQGHQTVTVPHFKMSLQVLKSLPNKPMAIIFSGNNADWQNLPMFEYYGEFEVYREVDDIPMMGICAGNEFYAMAYGHSFAHWMGWFDSTMFRITRGEIPSLVEVVPEYKSDPIFEGISDGFRAVEIHSWAISPLFLEDPRYTEFVETAHTSYIQTLKSTERPCYSEQFHGAVVNDYNQSGQYLANFLKIASSK
ncbi:MAG: discoidin domain-containing protein [Planctomycetes bacterium]|nr:discoidin domain-containing protein [Planctomycetota bacterium]